MKSTTSLDAYTDELGNEVVYGGPLKLKVDIRFAGSGNRVVIHPDAALKSLIADFRGSDGLIEFGPTTATRSGLRFGIRVGHSSTVRIGQDVGCQGYTFISATEGANVTIGSDVMFATDIEVRTDDTHAIYDVRSGERANPARSIVVGDHVWIAKHAVIMGGVRVGNGSVIGLRSIVTSSVPNNCVAVGSPARVVRRDIAWERPVTVSRRLDDVWPLPHEVTVEHWNLTEDGTPEDAAWISPSDDGVLPPVPTVHPVVAATKWAQEAAARAALEPPKPAPPVAPPVAPPAATPQTDAGRAAAVTRRSASARKTVRRLGGRVRRAVRNRVWRPFRFTSTLEPLDPSAAAAQPQPPAGSGPAAGPVVS